MKDDQFIRDSRLRRRRHPVGGFTWGSILVTLGIIFLLQNLHLMSEHFNWWALFILVPALISLTSAFTAFQGSGWRINAAAGSGLGGGLVILTVALMFLFDLNWSVWWPLMLIVPGFAVFINGFNDRPSLSPIASGLVNLSYWSGAALMLLGAAFQFDRLGFLHLAETFGRYQWWGAIILIVGLGLVFNAYRISGKETTFGPGARVFLFFGLTLSAIAVLALLGLDLNLALPILLIVAGLAFLSTLLFRR